MQFAPVAGTAYTNSGEVLKYEISEQNQTMIMDILATKLYTDPTIAPIREIVTNAFDAHLMSGKQNQPVLLTPPTRLSPTFVVRDFGPGISQENMQSFLSFGDSNKRDIANATGGFGIGSKSPFAVTNDFTVTVYREGHSAIWRSYKLNGKPMAALLSYTPSDEPSGVKFEIPIRLEILTAFNIAISDFLSFVQSPYKLTVPMEVSIKPLENGKTNLPFPVFITNSDNARYGNNVQYLVRMGDIVYKIPDGIFKICHRFHCAVYITNPAHEKWFTFQLSRSGIGNWRNHAIGILDFPIGTFPISPSREELIDSPSSGEFIKKHFSSLVRSHIAKVTTAHRALFANDTVALEMFAISSFLDGWDKLNNNFNADRLTNSLILNELTSPSSPLSVSLEKRMPGFQFKTLDNSGVRDYVFHMLGSDAFRQDVGLRRVDTYYTIGDVRRTEWRAPTFKNILNKRDFAKTLMRQTGNAFFFDLLAECGTPLPRDVVEFVSRPYCCIGIHNTTGKGYKKGVLYYATKPLEEIKDPIHKFIVAYFFEQMPRKQEEVETVKSPRSVILKRTEEVPPIYVRNGSNWKPVTTPPVRGVLLTYKTGVSRSFSEYDPNISPDDVKRAVNALKSTQGVYAIRDDMKLDVKTSRSLIKLEEYVKQAFHHHESTNICGVVGSRGYIDHELLPLYPRLAKFFANYETLLKDKEELKFFFGYWSQFLINGPKRPVCNTSPIFTLPSHYIIDPEGVRANGLKGKYTPHQENHLMTYIMPFVHCVAHPGAKEYIDILSNLDRMPTIDEALPHLKSFVALLPQIIAHCFEIELEDPSFLPEGLLDKYSTEIIQPLFDYQWPPIVFKKVKIK